MIHYDLRCAACGHEFDRWFDNMADYDDTKAALVCPSCGERRVEKAIMAPNVGKSKASAPAGHACEPASCGNRACPMAQGF